MEKAYTEKITNKPPASIVIRTANGSYNSDNRVNDTDKFNINDDNYNRLTDRETHLQENCS